MFEFQFCKLANPPRLWLNGLMQPDSMDDLLIWRDAHDPNPTRGQVSFHILSNFGYVGFSYVFDHFPASHDIELEPLQLATRFNKNLEVTGNITGKEMFRNTSPFSAAMPFREVTPL